jgi:hypothetical protein
MDPKNNLIEDSGSCELKLNPADTRFFIQTPYDKYWKCASVGCSSASNAFWRTAISSSADYTQSVDPINDWQCPVTDNDPNAPFCTPVPLGDAMFGYYKCKQVKCIHQRKLITTENKYDF